MGALAGKQPLSTLCFRLFTLLDGESIVKAEGLMVTSVCDVSQLAS